MEKKVSGKHSSMNGFAMMKGRVVIENLGISPNAFRENHTLVYGFPFAFFSYSLYLCTALEEKLHSTI